jgi:hypothetical protein
MELPNVRYSATKEHSDPRITKNVIRFDFANLQNELSVFEICSPYYYQLQSFRSPRSTDAGLMSVFQASCFSHIAMQDFVLRDPQSNC